MTECDICHRLLDQPDDEFSENCGGTCLKCMADLDDPDAVEAIRAILAARRKKKDE